MSDSSTSGGIGLCGALFILFLALRLTDHIDWEWYWVGAPLWMPMAIGLVIAALASVLYGVASVADWAVSARLAKRKNRQRRAECAPKVAER